MYHTIAPPTTRLATRPGTVFLETEVTVPHCREKVWSVVADYDNLSRYMPNLQSRIVRETETGLLVEQIAQSSLVPVLQFRLLLEFVRATPERLDFRRVDGNLSRFDGCWSVTSAPPGSRILYQLTVQHGFPLPGVLLEIAVRADVEKIMPAIVAELGRRSGTAIHG